MNDETIFGDRWEEIHAELADFVKQIEEEEQGE